MKKGKTFDDIFNEVALKKFGVAKHDIKGRYTHFNEIMTETMRIFMKRLKAKIRRTTMKRADKD